MNRLKQAWLVLTGKARTTDLSQESVDRITSHSAKADMTQDAYLEAIQEIGDATLSHMDEVGERQDAVVAEAEEIVRNA